MWIAPDPNGPQAFLVPEDRCNSDNAPGAAKLHQPVTRLDVADDLGGTPCFRVADKVDR